MSTKGTELFIEKLIENRKCFEAWNEIDGASELNSEWVDTQLIKIIEAVVADHNPNWVSEMVMRITDKRKNNKFILDTLSDLSSRLITSCDLDQAKEIAKFINENEAALYGDSVQSEDESFVKTVTE
ncbi:hypothetical protein ACFL08_05080 [Patescibacteria group bacterium]